MAEYSKESALSHLKENWNNVSSPVGFLGVNKIYNFYNHMLSVKSVIIIRVTLAYVRSAYTKQTKCNHCISSS